MEITQLLFYFFSQNPKPLKIANSLCRVNPQNSPRARLFKWSRIPLGTAPPPFSTIKVSQWEAAVSFSSKEYCDCLQADTSDVLRWTETGRRWGWIYGFDIYKHPSWSKWHVLSWNSSIIHSIWNQTGILLGVYFTVFSEIWTLPSRGAALFYVIINYNVKTNTVSCNRKLWPLWVLWSILKEFMGCTHTAIYLFVKGKPVKANALSIPLAVESVS